MAEERDINNLIIVNADETAAREVAFQALEKLVRESWNHVVVAKGAINFNTDWEPPFKQLKAFTKDHPDVELTLLADAFAHRHWICKSTIAQGKSKELVLSRIDDEFDGVFEEIYGRSYESWEKENVEPFAKIVG